MISTDVLVIGAGLSGVDMAYRIREANPNLRVSIVDARSRPGGTWDLFRYPGVRSDSDFYTLAFPFNPWAGANAIVEGQEILDYLDETLRRTGIADLITYNTHVHSANWDSEQAQWILEATQDGQPVQITANFVAMGTGYYDYDNPHDPEFAGLSDFAGQIVHPQFWPEDLDHTGKRVVVIGSGATAITVVPAMAGAAEHVTMLQRTPSYILAEPRKDVVTNRLRKVIGSERAYRFARSKNIALQWLLYNACQKFPSKMRWLLNKGVASGVGSSEIAQAHFNPPYQPWDQRLCIAPDGDFFAAIKSGDASVVTDTVDRFVPEGIRLGSGTVLPADIVVTATGLRIKLLGGIELTRDGAPIDLSQSVTWHGTMLSGVPNLAVCIGYINLSWTVRADATAVLVAKVIAEMGRRGTAVVEPVAPADLGATTPFMDMQSGYLQRGAALMPRTTQTYPWAVRQSVYVDVRATNNADLEDGLVYSSPASARSASAITRDGAVA